MHLGPIHERVKETGLPKRIEHSRGLFAWGRPKLRSGRLAIAWAEFLVLFVILPAACVFLDAISIIPIVIAMMLGTTTVLLSMTRSFHWDDLAPIDPLSEWRVALCSICFFAVSATILTFIIYPSRFMSPEGDVYLMLIAFPFLTALPIELIYRALFFRRFGHLFQTEAKAIAIGALGNGLVYYMLSHSLTGAAFGVVTGAVLGWIYLRTGQFLLCVGLHWVAALCIWIIGPGFGPL